MADLAAARAAYIQKLHDLLDEGQTNEQTFRSDFQIFLEAGLGVRCRNESVTLECGTPDIQVYQGRQLVGFVENKRPGLDLEAIHADSELDAPASRDGRQLQRYRKALHNLLLTNHRSVAWYVQGERIATADLEDAAQSDPVLNQFVQQDLPPIKNASVLVSRMADLARLLRDNLRGALSNTSPGGMRTQLHQAQAFLNQSLDEDDFADMVAQTVAYGLFAARVHEPDRPIIWALAPELVPVTNPFLQDMLDDLSSMRVRRAARVRGENWSGHVHLLIDLLNGTDIRACLEGFAGAGNGSTDPVIYFYEHFLRQYDPEQRRELGVYYTPDPVVDFIVRSVDEILQQRFGLVDGLADSSRIVRPDDAKRNQAEGATHRVHILDPACGTGSFLYRVVGRVRQSLAGNQGVWQDYVKEDLLPRLHGFEFQMAPHTIAHIKMAWLLQALDLPADERKAWEVDLDNRDLARFGIYLTNSLDLDPPGSAQKGLDLALADEAAAAGKVKSEVPVMVVLGNPPYKGESANPSRTPDGKPTPIGKLIEDYNKVDGASLGEANSKWLQDDYVKFIRAAQERIERTGSGVVAFITNHQFLDAVTFRGMRSSLMDTFDELYFLNLHGNLRTGSPSLNGGRDENVFDVQAGVCVSFMVKLPQATGKCTVQYADVLGSRRHKFNILTESSWAKHTWTDLEAAAPAHWFVPRSTSHEAEYRRGFSLRTVFPIQSSGIATARDDLVVNFTLDECRSRLERFRDLGVEQARTEFRLRQDTRDWQVGKAQADLKDHRHVRHLYQRYLYRPFDWRYTAYTGQSRGIQCMPRMRVMQHLEAGSRVSNMGLLYCRQMSQAGGGWRLVGVTDCLADLAVLSNKTREVATVAPLYTVRGTSLYCKENGGDEDPAALTPNLDSDFIEELEARLGMTFDSQGSGNGQTSFGPEHCLNYIYAVLHSSAYRERYEHLLRTDYPVLPWPRSAAVFLSLAASGGELVRLHLLKPSASTGTRPTYPVSGSNRVEAGHPEYDGQSERVYINEQQYFAGVSPLVWAMEIGSHQPLRKWLQDRRDRELTYAERQHYPKVVLALSKSLDTLKAIDDIVGNGEGLWLAADGTDAALS